MMGGQSGLAQGGRQGVVAQHIFSWRRFLLFSVVRIGLFSRSGFLRCGSPGAAAERSVRRLRGGEAPSRRRRGHDAILGMYGQGTLPPPFVDPVVVREGTASQ